MCKQIWGGAEIGNGRPGRRNGVDPCGRLQYWYKNQLAGTVLIMRPTIVTESMVYASAAAHIAEWDECYIVDVARQSAGTLGNWEPWITEVAV